MTQVPKSGLYRISAALDAAGFHPMGPGPDREPKPDDVVARVELLIADWVAVRMSQDRAAFDIESRKGG